MLKIGPRNNYIPCFKVNNNGYKMLKNVESFDLRTYDYKKQALITATDASYTMLVNTPLDFYE